MKQVPRVADYMATRLLTFEPDEEINRAMLLLLEHRYSGAPVVDASGRLVGVLSKKDCMKAALGATYHRDWGGTVEESMTRDVRTLEPDMSILDAAELMLAGPYRRFPVLRDGALAGQISRHDVLRALADEWNTTPPPGASAGEDRSAAELAGDELDHERGRQEHRRNEAEEADRAERECETESAHVAALAANETVAFVGEQEELCEGFLRDLFGEREHPVALDAGEEELEGHGP